MKGSLCSFSNSASEVMLRKMEHSQAVEAIESFTSTLENLQSYRFFHLHRKSDRTNPTETAMKGASHGAWHDSFQVMLGGGHGSSQRLSLEAEDNIPR